MVVQPSESEFALSSTKSNFIDKSVNNGQKNTTHKEREKKALDEFLLQYAVLDKNTREDMLRKLRRLIEVYFATPDGYKAGDSVSIPSDVDTSDFNVWAKHEEGKKKEGKYIILPEILHNADNNTVFDSVTEKDLKTKLTELIVWSSLTSMVICLEQTPLGIYTFCIYGSPFYTVNIIIHSIIR